MATKKRKVVRKSVKKKAAGSRKKKASGMRGGWSCGSC